MEGMMKNARNWRVASVLIVCEFCRHVSCFFLPDQVRLEKCTLFGGKAYPCTAMVADAPATDALSVP